LKLLVQPLLALAAALHPLSAALAAEKAVNARAGSEELEEVVVSADLTSFSKIRKAIVDAEDRFYARYNELNDDDAYDIDCRVEAPTGRRITARVCEPRYATTATHEEASQLLMNSSANVRFTSMDEMIARRLPELKRRMLQVTQDDQALQRALVERATLEQALKQLQDRKFNRRR